MTYTFPDSYFFIAASRHRFQKGNIYSAFPHLCLYNHLPCGGMLCRAYERCPAGAEGRKLSATAPADVRQRPVRLCVKREAPQGLPQSRGASPLEQRLALHRARRCLSIFAASWRVSAGGAKRF